MEQLTKNQAVATSQEAVQNQNEPQLRDENAHNDKSVHGVLNPTYQAGLRRDAVQPDIEAERKKRDEIEAGKSYCSRRFGDTTCDDKSAQIYARFDKNDWRIQPTEFYCFYDIKVNTFGFFFFKQKTAYEIGLGIPAEPLFRSCRVSLFLSMALCLLLRLFVFRLLRLKRFSTLTLKVLNRSEERFSRNAETDLVCRLLLEKKKTKGGILKHSLGYIYVLY